MPAISVIIPVYNVEKYLRRCLDSVAGQTFSDWEAVCVNDGSSDSSLEILKEYSLRDSRFRIIDTPNRGLSTARNTAIAAAKGEFIVFLDSDDFIHPQTFELATAIQKRSGADIVSWYKEPCFRTQLILRNLLHLDNVNFRPRSLKRRFKPETVKYHYTEDIISVATELSKDKSIKNPIKHNYVWNHLFKRETISGIRFLPGIIFEDFPWWNEVLLKNPKTAYTNLPLYYYYWNPSSLDRNSARHKKAVNWLRGLRYIYEKYAGEASAHQMDLWSRHFKWPVIHIHLERYLHDLIHDEEYGKEALCILQELIGKGLLDDASTSEDLKTAGNLRELAGK